MYRSPGWLPTVSTASARSRWICARRASATYWGWRQPPSSVPGLASRWCPGRLKRSCRGSIPRPGSVSPPGRASRGRGCMTGRGLQRFRPAPPDGMQDEGYLELADLEVSEYDRTQSGLWTRGLLIRRNLADGACAYFTTWCPAGTGIETLVAVEGQRWSIEDSFETSKNELGLDHNETRSWHGWHRHVSLVMLAFAMLATIRHHANRQPPQKTPLPTIQKQNQPSSTGHPRKSAASPRSLRNGASILPISLPGRSGGGLIRPPQSARI